MVDLPIHKVQPPKTEPVIQLRKCGSTLVQFAAADFRVDCISPLKDGPKAFQSAHFRPLNIQTDEVHATHFIHERNGVQADSCEIQAPRNLDIWVDFQMFEWF